MKKKINKFLFWAPRIISIIFLCFLVLMSFDVFSKDSTVLQMLGGFFIHNIPAIILLIVLLISWKYEIVGGIVFILAGILYAFLVLKSPFQNYMLFWIAQISGVAFIIGILFLINWFKKH